ncbi:MAG: zinc ABC transporter substrate-binding protein [Phycisphaerales bacterium]
MKKTVFFTLIVLMLLAAIFASIKYNKNLHTSDGKITVVTTLFPLYDFAKHIGGEKVDVSLLLPPGVEPHSFEPTPGDIARIHKANVFVFTGEFMEPWAHEIISGIDNKNILIVDASTNVNLIPAAQLHEHGESEKHENHPHELTQMDPHIWLDFDNDKIIIDNITSALIKSDSENSEYYQHNADTLKKEIDALDKAYKDQLGNCITRTIVFGGHYAFGYMANKYNLNYLAAQGLSPDSEPTAQDLIDLVKQIRNDNIHYIFFEELTSPKIAETLANETNTKMLLLNAGHNVSRADLENNVSFISIMRKNLENLKIGLECK